MLSLLFVSLFRAERRSGSEGLRAKDRCINEYARDQREGKRMALGEIEGGAALFGGYLPPGEIRLALLPIQVV